MNQNNRAVIICPKCGKENQSKNEFCIGCGFHFKEEGSVLFQIVENLKADLYGGIICVVIFVGFMIFVTYGIISHYGSVGYISFLIIWPIIIGFLFWVRYYVKGFTKTRKFTITSDYIEIEVPHKPKFTIKWSEFDLIGISREDSFTTIPGGEDVILGPRFVYFNLFFKGKEGDQSYRFESGKDFKMRSRKKIIIALEQYAKEKGKNFRGVKWKDK